MKRMSFFLAGILLALTFDVAAQVYNFFPPPGLTYATAPSVISTPAPGATSIGNPLTVQAGIGGSTSGHGGNLTVSSGNGVGSTSGTGGVLNLLSGNGSANGTTSGTAAGGAINIVAGAGGGTAGSQSGGAIIITGGQGSSTAATGNAGSIQVNAGNGHGTTGNGGNFLAVSGDSLATNGNSGLLTIQSGNAAGTGSVGIIEINGGHAATTGNGGDISIAGGAGGSVSGRGGNVSLQIGAPVGGTANGNVFFTDSTATNQGFFDGRNIVITETSNAVGDTNGFLYLPAVGGVPTGVPANLTGNYANGSPIRYDTTDNRIYVYNSGWQEFNPVLTGLSASIGGGALGAGACASTATSVTNAAVGNVVQVTPNTYPGDSAFWKGYVSGAGTVTVLICESVAATPTASTYNIRVFQ